MNAKSVAALFLASSLPFAAATAEDFTRYSTEDLLGMRAQTQYMSAEDRAAYKSERQSRMQSMTPEERQVARSNMGSSSRSRQMSGAGNGQGTKTRSRLRNGSGGGSGNRYGGGGGVGGRGRGR